MKTAEHRSLPKSAVLARHLGEKAARIVIPSAEITDNHQTLAKIEDESKHGHGTIFVFNHFGWGDPVMAAFKFFFAQPELKNMEVVTPQSLHQYKEIYSFFMRLFGCYLVAVVNQNTLDKPEFAQQAIAVMDKLQLHFMELSADVLQRGGAVGFAINAGRTPFLDMDNKSMPLGTLMMALQSNGITHFGVVPLALGIVGAESYEKRVAGGTNISEKYSFTLGRYMTAEEVLAQAEVLAAQDVGPEAEKQKKKKPRPSKKIDQVLKDTLADLVPPEYLQPSTFKSLAIIGAAGQTGHLFFDRAKYINDLDLEAVVKPSQAEQFRSTVPETASLSTSLVESVSRHPEAIILATANPTREILEEIASVMSDDQAFTLILPQNGVEVTAIAQEVFAGKKVQLIRASLFSPVSKDSTGKLTYNPSKLRIGIAAVPEENTVYAADLEASLLAAKALFLRSRFDVEVFPNATSMEWTKLILNGLGATGAITGLAHKDTFRDKELFALEAQALQDRLRLLELAGIDFAKVPWQNATLLKKLQSVPIPALQLGRNKFASMISKGRSPEPPAAARKIAERKPTETSYYHQPFVDLAAEYQTRALVDEAILEVMKMHEELFIDLDRMSPEGRKQILLKVFASLVRKQ